MKQIKNFQSLAANYDAFFLDLWGVVHDGTEMYAGAGECLKQLHDAGKQVVLVSNAPRRAFRAVEVLDMLKVPREYYQHIYTSGEAAFLDFYEHRHCEQPKAARQSTSHQNEWIASPVARNDWKTYFFIGPERDAGVFDGLGMKAVERAQDAEFLLNVGFGSEARDVHDEMQTLEQGLFHNLPMLCLNPDMEVVKITGEVFECAGVIAKQYADMGGVVHYYGKPHAAIYQRAHTALGGMDKAKILAVGDGLYTDIEGANRFGVDALLISGGILKGQLPTDLAHINTPKFVMDAWVW